MPFLTVCQSLTPLTYDRFYSPQVVREFDRSNSWSLINNGASREDTRVYISHEPAGNLLPYAWNFLAGYRRAELPFTRFRDFLRLHCPSSLSSVRQGETTGTWSRIDDVFRWLSFKISCCIILYRKRGKLLGNWDTIRNPSNVVGRRFRIFSFIVISSRTIYFIVRCRFIKLWTRQYPIVQLCRALNCQTIPLFVIQLNIAAFSVEFVAKSGV